MATQDDLDRLHIAWKINQDTVNAKVPSYRARMVRLVSNILNNAGRGPGK